MSFIFAALALLLENLVGYPKALQDAIKHPVQWFGALIEKYDRLLNTQNPDKTKGRTEGMIALAIVLAIVGIPAIMLQLLLNAIPFGWVASVILATPFVAQKSLRDHVAAVVTALGRSTEAARNEVAKIVGRDPSKLDDSGISKATLESLAENTSDGIVAPALWFALLGLPGIVLYKAINTADSMIGHKSEKYIHFGWAAAKLDDLVNLPASRLTAALFAGAAWFKNKNMAKTAWNTALRDAHKHNSPNAGWPEAAMAGALALRFGGPREYDGETVDLPIMGNGRTEMTRGDIRAGINLYDTACLLLAGLFIVLGAILSAPWANLLP